MMFKIKNLSTKLLKSLPKHSYSKILRKFTVNWVINSNGARGNGKSSCILRAIEKISNEFFCLFLTFQQGFLF